jgi:hypothetical protein
VSGVKQRRFGNIDMSSFEALGLAYAFFAVWLFLFFGLLWKSKEAMTEVAWDAIPHARVSLRGHYRARFIRLYAFYPACVLGYILAAAGTGFAELLVAELASDESIALLAKLFAFVMFVAAASSVLMGSLSFLSLVQTIKENEREG